MNANTQLQAIEEFFGEIASLANAYSSQILRIAAMRHGDGFALLQGSITLSDQHVKHQSRRFETTDFLCLEHSLEELGFSARQVLDAILEGGVVIHGVELRFPQQVPGSHSVGFRSFDGTRLRELGFAGDLKIVGANDEWEFVQPPRIHQQIKTGSQPYDSVMALGRDYGLPVGQGLNRCFEIRALTIASFEQDSAVRGKSAHIHISLARSLDQSAVRIGLQGLRPDGGTSRASRNGSELVWSGSESRQMGLLILEIDAGVKLTCTLSYNGLLQDELVLADEVADFDTLKIAYSLFDREQIVLQSIVESRKLKNRDPHDFELAVGAILSMRGFRIVHVGSLPKVGDAPDILAVDSNGNLLVVECTLDLPDAAGKFSKLHARALELARTFIDHARVDIRVVPILAVAKPGMSLGTEPQRALNFGLLLWSSEQLEELRNRKSSADSSELFEEFHHQLRCQQVAAFEDVKSEPPRFSGWYENEP